MQIVSDLADFTVTPDIIHGHHHPLLIEALLRFPLVPAVSVCHDATSRLDEPFYFPRVLRYVAVDDRCRKRVEGCAEIPRGKIDVIWNAVDMERFQPRDHLPSAPKKALAFSDQTAQLPAIRRACKHTGLKLDVVGFGVGNVAPNPESILPSYDIVFAEAPALCVGSDGRWECSRAV